MKGGLPTYFAILDEISAEQTIKRSRFVAKLVPVYIHTEIEQRLQEAKRQHKDARHLVYAYRLGDLPEERYTDDGEPAGTAGQPVLDALRHKNLHNVLVWVVRYFGGTLLGTGGLVRAYASTVELCLAKAYVFEDKPIKNGRIQLPYSALEPFFYVLQQHGGEVSQKQFLEDVAIVFNLPEENLDAFLLAIRDRVDVHLRFQWD